jgi:hypothetical protein
VDRHRETRTSAWGNLVSEQQPGSTTPEAGWYAYPDGGTVLRWWSGAGWTDQYAPLADATDAETASAPGEPDAQPAYGPVATVAPAGPGAVAPTEYGYAPYPPATVNPRLRWSTWSVWLLAFSPWLTMASAIAAFYVYASTDDAIPYWILVVLAGHAITTGLAVLDGRRLRAVQHSRVPHWAWSLPGVPVYLIVRAVVLRNTTVGGTTPLWVALVNSVLTWVLFFVVFFVVGALTLWVIQSLSDSMSGVN